MRTLLWLVGSSLAMAQNPGLSRLPGTWSGTFFSKHSSVSPFTMTVVVSTTPRGQLVANSTLNSECLKGAQMEVTIDDGSVVFAGTDEEGDTITLRGALDTAGTLLQAHYILNGSASGRCETDDGSGSLGKH